MTFPYGKTVKVEGGLKARSTRGAIGETWWSQRFIAVLESFSLGTRLTRGRNYARKGQVLALTVEPGAVKSTVQGSRETPYRVSIGLPVLGGDAWAAVEVAIASQAVFSARLLAGEMPPALEDVFGSVGAPLFPTKLDQLAMSCSCPDFAVPCKHLAATFYLLAEAFDDDPFLILRWRGRDRETLLGRLRELRADGTPAEQRDQMPAAGTALALADLTEPGDCTDRFWQPGAPPPARPAVMNVEPDLVLRQLPLPDGALGGAALVDRLRTAYRRFAGAADDG